MFDAVNAATGQRFHGYVEAMTEAGLSVDADLVAQGYFTYRSGLEAAEKLEQLRALDNGVEIAVVKVLYDSVGVDVPADLRRVEELLRR